MERVVAAAEHFWILEKDNTYSLLFEGIDRAMLVDTGFGELPVREIAQGLTRRPLFLVNTHTDEDHIGRNRDFSPVYMHPAEMDHYRNALPEGCRMEDVRPLWEGDVIDLGYWKFEVLLTPGHTPGSIMLLERQKRMLLTGDTIQDGTIFLFGAGRNIQAFQCSLQRLIAMSDAFDTLWPAHGHYPLKADILPAVLQGTQDLLDGKLTATEPPWRLPCKMYSCGVTNLLYSFD